MKRLLNYRSDILLLLTTLLWGSSFITTEYLLHEVDFMTLMALRNLLAGLVVLLCFLKYLKHFSWKSLGAASVLGVLLFAGGLLQTGGMIFSTPEKTAFITSFQNLFIPFISILFLRKKPSPFSIAGLVCAFAGMYFITIAASPNGFSGGWGIGETLTLISAFIWAWYIIFISKFSKNHNLYFLSIIQLFVAGIMYAAIAMFIGSRPMPNTTSAWLLLLYVAILPSAGATIFMMIGQRHTPPTRAAVIYSLEPVFALAFRSNNSLLDGSYALANLPTLIGGAAIVFGVLVSELGPLLFYKEAKTLNP